MKPKKRSAAQAPRDVEPQLEDSETFTKTGEETDEANEESNEEKFEPENY